MSQTPLACDLAVVGGGPGGYTAAFAAADQGRRVVLIDDDRRLGGVCLNRGCIPSKALLHATSLLREATVLSPRRGIAFGKPSLDLAQLRSWTESILVQLGQGLETQGRHRQVTLVRGRGRFTTSKTIHVRSQEGEVAVAFETGIIAVGSAPATPRAISCDDPRVMTSDGALQLEEIPKELLVVGGGYIGLELGTVYAALGSRVVLVEALESILPGVDGDLSGVVLKALGGLFREVRLKTTVTGLSAAGHTLTVRLESEGKVDELHADRVLVAVGRVPNTEGLGLERTRVQRDAQGFITVNSSQQTTDPSLYAIGDVVGGKLLAHKASAEAVVAVEAIVGGATQARPAVIPSVVFTDPELAWCGLTQTEAQAGGIPVRVARFPWSASGRAATLDRPDGLTKLVCDPESERVLGVGIAGVDAGELIGEGVLAVELGATAKDLRRLVLPHPTLSETLKEAAGLMARNRPAARRAVSS